jgi:hypothetical protein
VRGLIHTAEMDSKAFDAARSVIVCVDLTSVRLSRFKFSTEISVDAGIDEVSLSSVYRYNPRVNEGTLIIDFDLGLRGSHNESVVLDLSARIEARYCVNASAELSDFQMKSFARSNGMLNVWPYWRYFVQETTQKAGILPLTLPLFRVLHKKLSGPKPQ